MKPNSTDYLHLHYAISKMSPQIRVAFFKNHSSFVGNKNSIKNILIFFVDENNRTVQNFVKRIC